MFREMAKFTIFKCCSLLTTGFMVIGMFREIVKHYLQKKFGRMFGHIFPSAVFGITKHKKSDKERTFYSSKSLESNIETMSICHDLLLIDI